MAKGKKTSRFEDLGKYTVDKDKLISLMNKQIRIGGNLKDRLQTCISRQESRPLTINDYTSYLGDSGAAQKLTFPNQYYVIAAEFNDLTKMLLPYVNFIENEIKNKQNIMKAIYNKEFSNEDYNALFETDEERETFENFIQNSDKSPVNREGEKYNTRSPKDYFKSCFLNLLKLSQSSSEILSFIAFYLAKEDDLIASLKELAMEGSGQSVADFPFQQIIYGAPGSGKSHKINHDLFNNGGGLDKVPIDRKFRTTFHPDYDYAQFVGAYKPKSYPEPSNPDKKQITYEFVPQVFAKAYIKAWELFLKKEDCQQELSEDDQIYLVIEEINRGNCAQIFGDIFQLLDRKEDRSEYPVDIDSDFAKYIKDQFEKGDLKGKYAAYIKTIEKWESEQQEGSGKRENQDKDLIFDKIALPPNFNILATMNTSDQSLFPMDTAFKRRFEWKYVEIQYGHPIAKNYEVDDGQGLVFKWLNFLKKVNADIYKTTLSEDKQMGEFFIKPKNGNKIGFEEFRSKVMFYLWDSVYKDDSSHDTIFHFDLSEEGKKSPVTFQRLFRNDFSDILKKILENLDNTYNEDEYINYKILQL